MSSSLGSIRDSTAKPIYQAGVSSSGPVPIVGLDAAIAAFVPLRNGVYLTVPTAARAWTITEAGMALASNLAVGEGYFFWVQNNSGGANTITITAGGGANVASGAGTFTIAQATTRQFYIRRTGAATHELTTFGTWTH